MPMIVHEFYLIREIHLRNGGVFHNTIFSEDLNGAFDGIFNLYEAKDDSFFGCKTLMLWKRTVIEKASLSEPTGKEIKNELVAHIPSSQISHIVYGDIRTVQEKKLRIIGITPDGIDI